MVARLCVEAFRVKWSAVTARNDFGGFDILRTGDKHRSRAHASAVELKPRGQRRHRGGHPRQPPPAGDRIEVRLEEIQAQRTCTQDYRQPR